MEEIALGCLGWKPDDFLRYSGSDLIKAVNGYAEDQKVKWERIRVQCAYGLLPHYSSTKHGELKFSDCKSSKKVDKRWLYLRESFELI